MSLTSERTHSGKAAPDAESSDIVIKDVTEEEFCELCLSRRTLYRSDIEGLRGLFEPATRTQFVEQPHRRARASRV